MKAHDATVLVAAATPEDWASRIRPHLQAAVENIISAGTELLAAKDALPHGAFGQVVESLGLTRRTAQRFMAIARHPVLSNATHESHLPMAWTTLFELSKVDPEILETGLEAGTITPQTSRAEATELAKRSDADDPVLALVVVAIEQMEVVVEYLDENATDFDAAELVKWYGKVADIAGSAQRLAAERKLRYERALGELLLESVG